MIMTTLHQMIRLDFGKEAIFPQHGKFLINGLQETKTVNLYIRIPNLNYFTFTGWEKSYQSKEVIFLIFILIKKLKYSCYIMLYVTGVQYSDS